MIPKRIFTIWLSDKEPRPTTPLRNLLSHVWKLDGYEVVNITLDNVMNWVNSEYVKKAVLAKEWTKASDYLRMELVYYQGGVYLDHNVEVLRSFDDLLRKSFFASWANASTVGNTVIGSQRGFPLLREIMYEMERDPSLVGSQAFSQLVQTHADEVFICQPDHYFAKRTF